MAKTKTPRKTQPATRTKKETATVRKPAGRTRPPRPKITKASQGDAPAKARPKTKQAILISQLRRPDGAGIADLVKATGWQAHSVRGAISGTLKKKLGLAVTSEKLEGRGRVYRIVAGG